MHQRKFKEHLSEIKRSRHIKWSYRDGKKCNIKKKDPYKSTQHFHKLVKGNFSRSSIIFDGIGIGLQCVPNSVMSLIYNTLKPSHLWEAEDLDKVLQSGNILYNSIGKKQHC